MFKMFENMAFVSTAHAAESMAKQVSLADFTPFVLIIVVIYFFIIRPQQKKMKEHNALISSITNGQKILTSGGIVGTVLDTNDKNYIELMIASGVSISIRRDAITEVLDKNDKHTVVDDKAIKAIKSSAKLAKSKPQKKLKKVEDGEQNG